MSSATFRRRFARLISRLVRPLRPITRDVEWTSVALPIPGPAA